MIRYLKQVIKYYLYKLKWRGLVSIGWGTSVTLQSCFEGRSRIEGNSSFHGHLGYGSYITHHCDINAIVGRFTSIAPYVCCNPGQHPCVEPFVSTSPCFFSLETKRNKAVQAGFTFADEQCFDEFRFINDVERIAVRIGNDCWIGQGAFLVGSITIGDGAVVLAGAVVAKDVPPYAIVGGVPAKILRYRYDNETVDFLMKVQWWNMGEEWLETNWRLMTDMKKFKEYFGMS